MGGYLKYNDPGFWQVVTDSSGRLVEECHFPSWADYVDTAERCEHAPKAGGEGKSCRKDDWCGGTWEEAINYARYGWAKGRKLFVKELGIKADRDAQGVAPMRRLGVAGFAPHIPNAIAGVPNSMVGKGEDLVGGKRVVRLLASFSFSAGVSTKEITNRGVAIANAVHELEGNGYSVELIANQTVNGYGGGDKAKTMAINVTVKTAGESLNIDRVAYAMAHPSMLRRIGLSITDCLDWWVDGRMDTGYGMPSNPIPDEQQVLLPSIGGWGNNSGDFSTRETSNAAIVECINEAIGREDNIGSAGDYDNRKV